MKDNTETERSCLLPEQIGPFICKIAVSSKEIKLGRKLHHDGYLKVGYISRPSPTGMIEDPYVESSDFIIAILPNDDGRGCISGEIVGVVRIIKDSNAGYPLLNEFELYPRSKDRIKKLDFARVVEISSLSVKPGYGAAKALYRYAWQYSKARGDLYWLAAIDRDLFDVFRKRFHFYFDRIGRDKLYLGSITVPAMLDCIKQKELMYKHAPGLASFYDKPQIPKKLIPIWELV